MWERFIEATGRHFHFLETDFGFVRTLTKPPFVDFESDKLKLTLYFDESRGNELDLGIRRASDGPIERKSLGIAFLMRLKDGPNSDRYRAAYPSTEEALEIEMARLAELLRKYGSDILKGNLEDFEKIEQVEREELAAAYAQVKAPNVPKR